MENPVALKLWISVALYAALGMFGIAVFHDTTPSIQSMTDGYGIAYAAIAAPAAAK